MEGVHRYGPDNSTLSSFPAEREVRAVVEGQFLAKYVHAHSLGYRITPNSRILATGGASQNESICQVFYIHFLLKSCNYHMTLRC